MKLMCGEIREVPDDAQGFVRKTWDKITGKSNKPTEVAPPVEPAQPPVPEAIDTAGRTIS